ncbi:hypothetical protein FNL39_11484 [Nocardia caishijiensis]|uniref:Uncharacterized protein n=1 Tax=Nocardia caishijiensis TaxID=184756 RepID=A0ABQ6YF25_9NOCA|nr:hypothetical protein FNL39_11484 [Nocardia caishijiensis]
MTRKDNVSVDTLFGKKNFRVTLYNIKSVHALSRICRGQGESSGSGRVGFLVDCSGKSWQEELVVKDVGLDAYARCGREYEIPYVEKQNAVPHVFDRQIFVCFDSAGETVDGIVA